MDKIYLRLKDKTSTFWLAEQGISLVGEIPKLVEKTHFVSKLLKNGVAEIVSSDFARKYFQSDEDRQKAFEAEQAKAEMDSAYDAIAGLIKKEEFQQADVSLKEFKVKYPDEDTTTLHDEIKEGLEELKAHEEKKGEIRSLIEKAIQEKLIVMNSNGYSIDGKIVAENEDTLIKYLIRSNKIRASLEKKLE
jgi:vacuolar-type H+-ATPase subunit I/STV1